MSKVKIALLYGGVSGEREISISTGKQIEKTLNPEKYIVSKYDPKKDLKKFFLDAIDKKFDLVFPALHGPFGEDGRLQGMLDMIGMPYVFSGCLASALAMNKYKTKVIAHEAGLNVASNIVIKKDAEYNIDGITDILSLPIVIKPMELGSSVGISIIKNKKDLETAIKKAFKHSEEIMLEKFIEGREFTVAIMGNDDDTKTLPITEIIPISSAFYDYDAKYTDGGSKHICPAEITEKTILNLQKMAINIYNAVGCKDLARADFIWSEKDKKIYFIEINTIPGMTKTSLAPESAHVAGINFENFLDKLIEYNL